ncbi:MAG: 50S ribosomal protein L30 [Betaproteobacteria bacterium RBG_16_66_20]|nr:MAG: 50S ribosomal protein L30 [Betaproteobacteria bacterium RBG_16_66_20]
MADKKIRIKLVKGLAGCKTAHRATIRGLGLKRVHHVVELVDTPEVRGMINRVSYLVRLES